MAETPIPFEEIDDEEQQLYEHYRIVVDKGQVPVRIDKYLSEHQPHSSRNRIQKAADRRSALS